MEGAQRICTSRNKSNYDVDGDAQSDSLRFGVERGHSRAVLARADGREEERKWAGEEGGVVVARGGQKDEERRRPERERPGRPPR